MIEISPWEQVNQDLIAKSIGELIFEQVLKPEIHGQDFSLKLRSGVTYTFQGKYSAWDFFRTKKNSVLREGLLAIDAGQFFLDTQHETLMTDIILGNFLEEMHNTLYADLSMHLKVKKHLVHDVANWNGEKIQSILNGHPKILLNKGRIGWGSDDMKAYAPESETSFQLHWVAIKKNLVSGLMADRHLLQECFTDEALSRINVDTQEYTLLPVHPWQWNHFISIQFAGMIEKGEILSLGLMGDLYRPQISIRTLSNVSRKEKVDIKLPLSILNTSCIRGLPAKGISQGTTISSALGRLCAEDPLLSSLGTDVLLEKAAVAVLHPVYNQVKDAPYRYHEYLGAIWRESAASKIDQNEKAILTASLSFQDQEGRSLIGEYIKRSNLSIDQWVTAYFKSVIIPLYHLQLTYGIGMVAHGQNIVLKLKNFTPAGIILKDFQGDLRLSNKLPEAGMKYFGQLKSSMTELPPHYLIHDLITGHFISVLRFISLTLEESEEFPETKFYELLNHVLTEYSVGRSIPDEQNLLAKTFDRVLLNKVRFAIGYADSALRPLPMVGLELKNPICAYKER